MKVSIKSLVAALALIASSTAHANITLGEPAYGGNGCPAGTVGATLDPSRTQLSILFDGYVAEAGPSVGKTIDRKSCNIAIPVHVPQGYSVSIFKLDYRGFVSVPVGGEARLSAEYFFAGARGPKVENVFRGPFDEDYTITDELAVEALVWSPCGASTNLRVNTSMLAKAPRRGDVLATVDSIDVDAGLVYHIRWRRCN